MFAWQSNSGPGWICPKESILASGVPWLRHQWLSTLRLLFNFLDHNRQIWELWWLQRTSTANSNSFSMAHSHPGQLTKGWMYMLTVKCTQCQDLWSQSKRRTVSPHDQFMWACNRARTPLTTQINFLCKCDFWHCGHFSPLIFFQFYPISILIHFSTLHSVTTSSDRRSIAC